MSGLKSSCTQVAGGRNSVKPTIYLRAAAVLTFLHSVLHTIGGVFGSTPPGPQQTAVMAMKSNVFQTMGVTRTYWDFFLGYGLFISLNLFVQAVLFWQLGTIAKKNALEVRPIIALFAIGYLGFAFLSWRYFFSAPMTAELLIAGCLITAFILARPARTA
jgi:hypothetical protein